MYAKSLNEIPHERTRERRTAAVSPIVRLHGTLPITQAHAPVENMAMSGLSIRAMIGCIDQPLLPDPAIAPCAAIIVAMTTVANVPSGYKIALSLFRSTCIDFLQINVGTSVGRRPPRRSRRAELPHRAPQDCAQVELRSWLVSYCLTLSCRVWLALSSSSWQWLLDHSWLGYLPALPRRHE